MFTYESPKQTLNKAFWIIVVFIMGVILGASLIALLYFPDPIKVAPIQITPVPVEPLREIIKAMEVVG